MDKNDEPKGPYKSTRTTTFEVTGPLKITSTTVEEATHPPKPCGCGGASGNGGQLLEQLMAIIGQRMGAAPDGGGGDGPPPHSH